jgi:hypothetical protein
MTIRATLATRSLIRLPALHRHKGNYQREQQRFARLLRQVLTRDTPLHTKNVWVLRSGLPDGSAGTSATSLLVFRGGAGSGFAWAQGAPLSCPSSLDGRDQSPPRWSCANATPRYSPTDIFRLICPMNAEQWSLCSPHSDIELHSTRVGCAVAI